MMKIVVFGLGAIGSNLILQLMKLYPDFEFKGVDYDVIEERNIKTQAYFLEQVGMPKTHAIPMLAQRYLRKVNYVPDNKKVEMQLVSFDWNFAEQKSTIPEDLLFIDCFDNSESRKFISGPKDANILHIGFSPQYTAEIIWEDKYDVPGDVDPEQSDICEMDEATAFIHYVVNLAALNICNFIKEKKKDSYIITNKTNIRKL